MAENAIDFESLFDTYKRYVYTICYQFTRSVDDALDLTQEVFLKIYQHKDKLTKPEGVKYWIRKVCVNTCINHKRDVKSDLSIEQENEQGFEIPDTQNMESNMVNSLLQERMLYHMDKLEPTLRMAVLLRHKGFSYKEIADTMECNENTIKSYLYKGRQILLGKLREEGILEV
jgi:RNA polymerase sigma-70 factor, ECF subfamily